MPSCQTLLHFQLLFDVPIVNIIYCRAKNCIATVNVRVNNNVVILEGSAAERNAFRPFPNQLAKLSSSKSIKSYYAPPEIHQITFSLVSWNLYTRKDINFLARRLSIRSISSLPRRRASASRDSRRIYLRIHNYRSECVQRRTRHADNHFLVIIFTGIIASR